MTPLGNVTSHSPWNDPAIVLPPAAQPYSTVPAVALPTIVAAPPAIRTPADVARRNRTLAPVRSTGAQAPLLYRSSTCRIGFVSPTFAKNTLLLMRPSVPGSRA